jgi:hypothetical protein
VLNFFQRRKILKNLNFLEATPVRVCGHQEEEDGRISVIVPKFRNKQFNDWFLGRRPKNFLIRLDKTGSEVWLLIDGKRTVGRICEELEKQNLEETVDRVTKFMTQLYEQRYITFSELEEGR